MHSKKQSLKPGNNYFIGSGLKKPGAFKLMGQLHSTLYSPTAEEEEEEDLLAEAGEEAALERAAEGEEVAFLALELFSAERWPLRAIFCASAGER